MIGIKPTCDRKTKFWSRQYNTFGLMPGKDGTCPGCTTGPKGCWHIAPGRRTHTCYVDSLMRCYTGIRGVLEHNTKLLKEASAKHMVRLLHTEFVRFQRAEREHSKSGEPAQLSYRLHWSGDVFSTDYAKALAEAMAHNPDISFWTYTRSFDAVPHLLQASNLTLYLSLDPENINQGLMTYDDCKGSANKNLQLCYMSSADDTAPALEVARIRIKARDEIRNMLGYNRHGSSWCSVKFSECPVDTRKLPVEYGCSKCKQCLAAGSPAVWFKC